MRPERFELRSVSLEFCGPVSVSVGRVMTSALLVSSRLNPVCVCVLSLNETV